MEELKYSNLSEIHVETKLVDAIGFKPKTAPIACIVIGCALSILSIVILNILVALLGIFFIVMAVLVIKLVEDRKIMDVYEDGVLIYKSTDQNLAFFLKNNEVKMWKCSRDNGHDEIMFYLPNDYHLGVETFEIEKAYDALMKTMPDKEERVIQREKNKKMKWKNPVETLRGLINRNKK